jgi:hypothetical protein
MGVFSEAAPAAQHRGLKSVNDKECEPMAETKTHTGGCHCKKVRFEVETGLDTVISCNCSNCQIRGLMLTFVTPDHFKLISGESDLTTYQFNKNVIHHMVCKSCGVEPFATGKKPGGGDMVAVNVRCIDDIELGAITPTPVDGRSL